jgi:hypothetical protein
VANNADRIRELELQVERLLVGSADLAQRNVELLARAERAEAALRDIHNLTRSESDVFILRLGSIAAQALYPDWRDGGVARAALAGEGKP